MCRSLIGVIMASWRDAARTNASGTFMFMIFLGAGPDFVVGVSCDMRYMGRIEKALSSEFGSLAFSGKDD